MKGILFIEAINVSIKTCITSLVEFYLYSQLTQQNCEHSRPLILDKCPKSVLIWQYGNRDVKSLFEHFRNNYLIEEEETSIIAQWSAMSTRPVRQKAISPNDVFSNLLA